MHRRLSTAGDIVAEVRSPPKCWGIQRKEPHGVLRIVAPLQPTQLNAVSASSLISSNASVQVAEKTSSYSGGTSISTNRSEPPSVSLRV